MPSRFAQHAALNGAWSCPDSESNADLACATRDFVRQQPVEPNARQEQGRECRNRSREMSSSAQQRGGRRPAGSCVRILNTGRSSSSWRTMFRTSGASASALRAVRSSKYALPCAQRQVSRRLDRIAQVDMMRIVDHANDFRPFLRLLVTKCSPKGLRPARYFVVYAWFTNATG